MINIQKWKAKTIDYFIDSAMLHSQKIYTIGGLQVYFPYEAYDVQLAYMEKVI